MSDTRSNPPEHRNRRLIVRILFYASAILCAVGWLALFVVTQQFIAAPTTPDRDSGRTIAWSNHGTNHYITPRDDGIKNAIIAFNVIMFVCAATLGYMDQNKK